MKMAERAARQAAALEAGLECAAKMGLSVSLAKSRPHGKVREDWSWNRNRLAQVLLAYGASRKAVGHVIGVTGERAAQMAAKHSRMEEHPSRRYRAAHLAVIIPVTDDGLKDTCP